MAEPTDAHGTPANVEVLDDDGAAVLKVIGEVDVSSAEALQRLIEPHVKCSPTRIVFDLSELTFMDSSGLAVLLGVAERVKVVELRRPLPMLVRVIAVTGLSDVFHVIE